MKRIALVLALVVMVVEQGEVKEQVYLRLEQVLLQTAVGVGVERRRITFPQLHLQAHIWEAEEAKENMLNF